MKVLVFDYCRKLTGHRIPYASLVANAFGSDIDTTICLPDLVKDQEQKIYGYLGDQADIDFFPAQEESGNFRKAFAAYCALSDAVSRHQPDFVAIPTADGLANVGGLARLCFWDKRLTSTKVDICLMKGYRISENASPISVLMSKIKWWLIEHGPWNRILLIDPKAWQQVSGKQNQESRLVLCPDPVPEQKFFDRDQARNDLGVPTDGRFIVSVGNQDRRKGIDRLMRAFEVANLNSDDRLLLVGKINANIKDVVDEVSARLPGRVITIDRFVTEDEFQKAIIASDLVALPYRSCDQPSGIVCRSMAWNRPIIATDSGWLKWVIQEYGAGTACHTDDIELFARELSAALASTDQFTLNEKAKQFVNYNTASKYVDTWAQGLAADSPDQQDAS